MTSSCDRTEPEAQAIRTSLISALVTGPNDARLRMPPGVRLIGDSSPEALRAVRRLRVLAWRAHVSVDESMIEWGDRWDALSQHRILMDRHGSILGGLRFSLHSDLDDVPDGGVWTAPCQDLPRPIAYSSRIFVTPDAQGSGLSKVLDYAAIEEPRRAGAACVVSMVGSTDRNRRRAEHMARFGWTRIGQATDPSPDALAKAAHLPFIFAVRFDDLGLGET